MSRNKIESLIIIILSLFYSIVMLFLISFYGFDSNSLIELLILGAIAAYGGYMYYCEGKSEQPNFLFSIAALLVSLISLILFQDIIHAVFTILLALNMFVKDKNGVSPIQEFIDELKSKSNQQSPETVAAPAAQPQQAAQQTSEPEFSVADELLELKQLLDQGIITEEDFNEKKKELLNM